MLPVDVYAEAPGRDDLIKQVRAKIDELGVDFIYYQYISITGRIMGKAAPAPHWESLAMKGIQTWYGGVTNVFPNRSGSLLGFPSNAHELIAIPDPDTFCQLPWNKRVGRVYCTVFYGREQDGNPGGFMEEDARGNLRRVHQQFMDDHDGLHLRHGCEPEMNWLKKGEDGLPDGGPTKPYAYHIDQFEELSSVFMKVIDYAQQMGLDMIQGDHEDAPGQLELNFMFDDAMRTCDRLTTYRQICAQVAREEGLIACFMSKPFMGRPANGCHFNMSLWRGGADEIVTHADDPLPGVPWRLSAQERWRQPVLGRSRSLDARPGRAPGTWRFDGPFAGLDRDRRLDRQFLSPYAGCGHVGAGLCRLGLPEPHDLAARLGTRTVRVPRG